MDVDMEFLEIADDKIQIFLSTKLEEIRLQNEALEIVLHERRQAVQSMPDVQNCVRIENIWKKIFNRRYAIGFEILSSSSFKDIRIVLTCDFEEPLSYKVQTVALSSDKISCISSKNCQYIICGLVKNSEVFENSAFVIISFNLPQFLDKLNYDLSGYVICTLDGQNVDMPLPTITLSAKDTVTQNNWLIEKNSLSNLFTVASCSNMIDLAICLPAEWTTPLLSTFEIHCSLTYIPIMDKAYFVAYKISELFDGTLAIVHPHEFKKGGENNIFLKVYTSCDEQLFAFLHHLLSCIPNCIIFPSMFYQSILKCRKTSYDEEEKKSLFEDFEKQMRADIDHSYFYARVAGWKTYSAENKTYKFNQQRQRLSKLESATDFNYLQVRKM